MKLSKREVTLLQRLRGARARRQKESVGIFLFIALVIASDRMYGWAPESFHVVMSMGLGLALGNVFAAFSTIRSDDRLNALLLRYIDSDAEALEQLSREETSSGLHNSVEEMN